MTRAFPLRERERQAVIEAYRLAAIGRCSAAQCYLAAVEALQEIYPDVPRAHIAREAVAVITTNITLVEVARR